MDEPKKKRQYNFSSKQKAKIAAGRVAKRVKDDAEKAAKAAKAAKNKLEASKKKLAATKDFADKVAGTSKVGYVVTDVEKATPTAKAIIDDPDTTVVFRPNKGKQEAFLAAPEKEVLYGGAAGGGKSYAMLIDPLRFIHNRNHKPILLRKSMPELQELIDKSHDLYPKAFPGAKWNQQKSRWTFPSGAVFIMSFVENDLDVHRYQGQAFTWIGVDELTHYATPYVWDYLRSRLRTTDPTIETYMRACIDEGDVLTEKGWKPIQEVVVGELVYTLLPSGEMVLRPVTQAVKYDVDEELVRVRKKNLYMSMTQDHRVVYKKFGKQTLDITRWNEHTNSCIDIVRSSSSYYGKGYTSPLSNFTDEAYAKFLGLFIAEGCTTGPYKGNYKVLITQNKSENHTFVKECMEAGGYNVCYSKNGDFQITNKELFTHLKPLGKAVDKHFPRKFLDNASVEQLKIALDAYLLGDGHWQSEKSATGFTCSKQLANDLQEIAIKLGYKTQVNHIIYDNPVWNDKYSIYFTLHTPTTKVDKGVERNDTQLEHYKGRVYCLGVKETENFVVRQKGYVWVSGNTTNPGGIGGWWVKRMFIEPSPYNTPFWATDIETGDILRYPHLEIVEPELRGKPLFKRRFIPAKLSDNPFLMQSPEYLAMLSSLPEVQRRRLLEGDWDVAEDTAFPEFDPKVHTCEPFEIPNHWQRYRSCDYGYVAPSAVLWYAVAPNGTVFVYRELYAKSLDAEALADKIRELEWNDPGVLTGPLDTESWAERGQRGPSIAETMIRAGIRWTKTDKSKGSRVRGKIELHRRLKVNTFTGEVGVKIFHNCRNLIRIMPMLPLDPSNAEDVDTDFVEDHLYDSFRYGINNRPTFSLHTNEINYSSDQPALVDAKFGY